MNHPADVGELYGNHKQEAFSCGGFGAQRTADVKRPGQPETQHHKSLKNTHISSPSRQQSPTAVLGAVTYILPLLAQGGKGGQAVLGGMRRWKRFWRAWARRARNLTAILGR